MLLNLKLYNKNLEKIEDKEKEKRFLKIAEKNIEFLVKNYGIDEQFLKKKLEMLSVVEKEGTNHFVMQNGKKHEINPTTSPASFVTKKNQEFDGKKWYFENAVYTNDNNGDHTITHELFHFFSANTEMDFDTNELGYDKQGVSINGYNKKDEKIDVKMNAKGLNEGITEMLAMQVDKMNIPAAYSKQVYLAEILISNQDNSLINAYFSENCKQFQDFLKKFDERQSTISSQELVSISTTENGIMDVDLLKGCLEYSLSYCNDIEKLTNERKRLLPIFKNINNTMDFADKNFDLKQFFSNIMNVKRQEIQNKRKNVQELGKESLPEIKETPYMDDTQQHIESQEKIMNKNKNNIQEKS